MQSQLEMVRGKPCYVTEITRHQTPFVFLFSKYHCIIVSVNKILKIKSKQAHKKSNMQTHLDQCNM